MACVVEGSTAHAWDERHELQVVIPFHLSKTPSMRPTTSILNNLRRSAMRGIAPNGSAQTRLLVGLHRSAALLMSQFARRTDSPWRALVLVPILLALAVVTLHLWFVPPLVALCWWWGSKDDPWMWVLGILEAAWGVQWGAMGLYGLMDFPHHRGLVEVLWVGYALAIAGVGAVNRWQFQRKYGL